MKTSSKFFPYINWEFLFILNIDSPNRKKKSTVIHNSEKLNNNKKQKKNPSVTHSSKKGNISPYETQGGDGRPGGRSNNSMQIVALKCNCKYEIKEIYFKKFHCHPASHGKRRWHNSQLAFSWSSK